MREMIAQRMSPAAVRELLEGCPTDPGPIAFGLVGWISVEGHQYCSICCGRLQKRGLILRHLGCSIPVWNRKLDCEACGKHFNADGTEKKAG